MIFSQEYIKKIDAKYWDPGERAQGVHNIVEAKFAELIASGLDAKELPSLWDRFCYAVEYIAQTSMSINNEQLTDVAKRLSAWLYNAHYSHPEDLYGKAGDKPLVISLSGPDLRRPFDRAQNGLATSTPTSGTDNTVEGGQANILGGNGRPQSEDTRSDAGPNDSESDKSLN